MKRTARTRTSARPLAVSPKRRSVTTDLIKKRIIRASAGVTKKVTRLGRLPRKVARNNLLKNYKRVEESVLNSHLVAKPGAIYSARTLLRQVRIKNHVHCARRRTRREVLAAQGKAFRSGGAPGRNNRYRRNADSTEKC